LSRIGKLPVPVPSSVKVTLAPGHVKVEGPKGQLERTLPADITVKQVDGELVFERPSDDFRHRALHGLVRSLVANMVEGVNKGFTKNLELVGVGYRVAKQGEELVLNLGYSHPIRFKPPKGISIDVADPTKFSVTGISIEDVGQVAANLRGLRPPEPYKGKGVKYAGEKIRRKPGKAGKGAKATA
jgi:large subunit ribosomal protein L6